MDEVCGFWLSSGQNPGQSVQIVLAGRSRFKEAKRKVSWASRLAGGVYPYQLTADVGFLKKGRSGKSKNPWRMYIKCSERKDC